MKRIKQSTVTKTHPTEGYKLKLKLTILLLAFKMQIPTLYPVTSTDRNLYVSVCSTFQRKTEDSLAQKHCVFSLRTHGQETVKELTCIYI